MRLEALPLAPVAGAFVGGLAAAAWIGPHRSWIWLVALAAALLSVWSLWRRREALVVPSLLVLFALLGFIRAGSAPLPPDHIARLPLPTRITVEGQLVEEPMRFAPDRERLLIDVEAVEAGQARRPARGRVQVTLYGQPPPLTEGQRVRGEFRLHRPLGFRNPAGFDYPAHLAREGIYLVGSGRPDRLEPITPEDPPWTVRVKRWALATLHRNLPPRSAALLAGLLLGERTGLPRSMDEAFRRAGVYHILAVSGFNVALIASTVFLGLRLVGLPRRLVAVVASMLLVGYALVVGGQPSVVRATVMGLLLLLGLLLERDANPINSLALAALGILLWRPGDLWEPGFQLSFAATLGILWLTPSTLEVLTSRGWPTWLAAGVAVSLGAQLAVTPIMLSHFNQLSLVGIAANLVVVPLAALATTLGLAALLAASVSDGLAQLFFESLWLILLALRFAARLASALPWALVHLPAPHWSAVAAFYGLLALVPRLHRSARATLIAGMLAAWVVALSVWPWLKPLDGRLRVTFLDVGQGDAIFVELPDGRRLLLDGGPGGERRFDVGERIIAPFLWNRGVHALDVVAMSHSDPDHAGGLAAVISRFGIKEFWDNGIWEAGSAELYGLVERSGAIRRSLTRGTRFWLGPVLVTVLNPPAVPLRGSPRGPASDENNNSLVLRLDWGLASFLFTGDLEQEGEAALLEARQPLGHLVLKVAHHGSRYSTTEAFLAAAQPRLAVVSAGARNPFRHPTGETLDRLDRAGARVFRTDRDGAIVLEMDGATMSVTRWATRETQTWLLDSEPEPGAGERAGRDSAQVSTTTASEPVPPPL
ncbi:MAG: DNA internalization-related competence protein ComEC/Rec2 [Candidatus Rokubacteria bacterium]|nr:DNA internalization-related competence protein ComEC/Rec2 [Candidatus Rokubacteria bacterium]